MQVIETLAEGLKREIKVVIPAKDMEARMNERLAEVPRTRSASTVSVRARCRSVT